MTNEKDINDGELWKTEGKEQNSKKDHINIHLDGEDLRLIKNGSPFNEYERNRLYNCLLVNELIGVAIVLGFKYEYVKND